jgi:hypothetical protein
MKYCTIETATAESIEAALDEAYEAVSGRHMAAKVFLSEPSNTPSRTNLRTRKAGADEYRKCADEGLTVKETAALLGIHFNTIRVVARRYGIKFLDGRKVRRRT